ncbi:MFS transporter [Hoeflea poritis]|uniref:MFS transporter n=1 Tax=Hoeflea poritis TaxID=2993659 RepID=A0ABT4VUL3_9HYPH|nr:MFS transporter [Hoeflea poritis]MDA4848405.1 MFS transporter [Hoeflea poritis]
MNRPSDATERDAVPVLVWSAALLCGLAVAYNSGAVMAASPYMKIDLDLDSNTLQWVMVSYMLVATVLVGVMGGFADIFGRLRLLMAGAVMFIAGSLICILADSGAVLIAGRSVQAVGGAGIFGTGVAVLTVATPQSQRALALGLWSAAVALGLGVGPLIGGALTDVIDWRAIFGFDILLLLAGLSACFRVARARLVPEEASPRTNIDYAGAALMMGSLGALTFALSRGPENGWGSAETITLLVAAAVAGAAFLWRENQAKKPMFSLRFFARPSYVAAATGTFISGFGMMGLIYYFNLFVQAPGGLNYSAMATGAALLPCTMLFFAGSIGLPRLLSDADLRWPATLGMVLMAAGFWLLRDLSPGVSYDNVWWKLILIGAGFGLTFGLLPRVGMRDLPDSDAGQGSGVINVCLYVGFTFGIAACGVAVTAIRHTAIRATVSGLSSGPAERTSLIHDLVHGSNSAVAKALTAFSDDDAATIKKAFDSALESGFDGAMMMLALMSAAGAVLCMWLLRKPASV